MAQENSYIFDVENTTELARLLHQGRATTISMKSLLPGEIDLNVGQIVDLGCGPGGWVLEVAQRITGQVVGVDVSAPMIAYAEASAATRKIDNASFRVANALEGLDFPDASVDIVNGRFMAAFLPQDGWLPLMREVKRILKPGGIFVNTEGDVPFTNGRATDQFASLLAQAMKLRYGFSPLGRTVGVIPMLGRFFQQAGFRDIEHQPHVLDASYGASLHGAWRDDNRLIMQMLKPVLENHLHIDAETLDDIEKGWDEEFDNEDYRCLTFLLSVWGTKP